MADATQPLGCVCLHMSRSASAASVVLQMLVYPLSMNVEEVVELSVKGRLEARKEKDMEALQVEAV